LSSSPTRGSYFSQQSRSPRRQQRPTPPLTATVPDGQHATPRLPVPGANVVRMAGQHLPLTQRFGRGQHFLSAPQIGPLQQLPATGPGAQPPLPSGCEARGLHGSQQPGLIWHPRELTGPGEQTVCCGQQCAKQNSVAGEQTLNAGPHPPDCRPPSGMRAPLATPLVQRPITVTPSTPSARLRGIGSASERASWSRRPLNA
jgi:hypothetical protein